MQDGQPFKPSDSRIHIVNETVMVFKIVIDGVDDGKYACVASNLGGSDRLEVTIEVHANVEVHAKVEVHAGVEKSGGLVALGVCLFILVVCVVIAGVYIRKMHKEVPSLPLLSSRSSEYEK